MSGRGTRACCRHGTGAKCRRVLGGTAACALNGSIVAAQLGIGVRAARSRLAMTADGRRRASSTRTDHHASPVPTRHLRVGFSVSGFLPEREGRSVRGWAQILASQFLRASREKSGGEESSKNFGFWFLSFWPLLKERRRRMQSYSKREEGEEVAFQKLPWEGVNRPCR